MIGARGGTATVVAIVPHAVVEKPQRPAPSAADLQAVVDEPLRLDDLGTPADTVVALPLQSFVQVARGLRDEARLDLLLAHATPDQLTSLLDLDAWEKDRLHFTRARQWLLAIAQMYTAADRNRGALADLMYRMDPEMWTVTLLPHTVVIDLDPDDEGSRDEAHESLSHLRTWDSPDGFFVVGVSDDEFGQMAIATIDLVYRDDLSEGRKLLLSIQSAIGSQIEEDLLSWRSGRLADLGFVSWEEAMKLFRPYDHKTAATEPRRDFRYLDDPDGALTLPPWNRPGLLKRVMDRLSDAEHGLRSREFLLLVNEVMAAQRFVPGDQALQERAIGQTQATISLGLELLLSAATEHPDPERFLADRVEAIGLRDVFRVGYGALDRIRKAAATLEKTSRVSLTARGSLLDRPWGPAVAALSRLYPELPVGATSKGTAPLQNFADVRKATALLAEGGALSKLAFGAEGFAIDPSWLTRVDEPEKLRIGDLIRTAIVHTHLPGTRSSLAPLTPADLGWAHEHLLARGALHRDIEADLRRRLDALDLAAHADGLVTNLLARLEAELRGLEFEDGVADLRKTGGFVTIQHVGLWLKTRTGLEN